MLYSYETIFLFIRKSAVCRVIEQDFHETSTRTLEYHWQIVTMSSGKLVDESRLLPHYLHTKRCNTHQKLSSFIEVKPALKGYPKSDGEETSKKAICSASWGFGRAISEQ
jgi:hypothetical protein